MRLWSIHPRYLDLRGLVALWREGLLARKVLAGKTKGYNNHPQLQRFKDIPEPIQAIESYLHFVYLESQSRGYDFDRSKLSVKKPLANIIPVTIGQAEFEFSLLSNKVKKRDREHYRQLCTMGKGSLDLNPVFYLVSGGVESWEKINF
ncbi:MAG: pyrimidine dimer DNA glycosylase/endonuclease V [bacterium]